jgi:regulator of cell morphogenesis and NO signaling
MTSLDIRPVEPRHRYETIIGAYEGLATGGAIELTVDHDPTCMYYALKATRGDDAFEFDYLERGPEVWRVRVRKLLDVESSE